MDYTVTRWPNGFVNAAPGSLFGDLKVPNPATYFSYFNDFLSYTAADWLVTETDAGATQGIVAGGANGQLLLQNTAGANDINSLQFAGGTGSALAQFNLPTNKSFFVGGRMKVDNANLATLAVGLAAIDTSPIASLPTNGVLLHKLGGTTNPTFQAISGSVAVSAQIADQAIVNDTFFTWGISFAASEGIFRTFFNGAAGRIENAVLPAGVLTPTIAVGNGSGVARSLTADWLFCAVER